MNFVHFWEGATAAACRYLPIPYTLDTSTSLALQNFVHFREGTVLMALLQPAPETYDLFDDVMLMSEGYILFHGARDEVRPPSCP